MTLSIAGLSRGMAALLVMAALAGCEREVRLTGERLDPQDALSGVASQPQRAPATPLALPAPVVNAEWSQRGGAATHRLGHVALSPAPVRIWSANVGRGDSKRLRVTADPVVAAGRIFTLDADARVSATSPSGAVLWSADVVPPGTRGNSKVIGGGLAYGEGKLFVTTGFGELVALDPASGAVVWRQDFDSAVGGAPAVAGGMVYVSTRSSVGWAMRAADGRVQWKTQGLPSPSSVAGVSAPAVEGDTVVFPFPSGELVAVSRADGARKWSVPVPGRRLGMGYADVMDITGEPVMAGGTVYAGTSAGRLAAVDVEAGRARWTAEEGAASAVIPAGGSIFLVTDESRLMRLDAATGVEIWAVELPYYVPTRREKRRRDIHVHYGPVLAGGRLVLASTDGVLRSYDPSTGALVAQAEIPGGAAAGPAVAGGILYVMGKSGQLHAFR
ncbi:pyrrolo-quinoline quinone [Frigidibacter albus]|nr:PQQ-like beta-propeller repeat protein [Frigidibacter albus]GGH46890.1 pyrrolo-quinoline quinone [Frigidibacter albus]